MKIMLLSKTRNKKISLSYTMNSVVHNIDKTIR